jgi:hypothetical protein
MRRHVAQTVRRTALACRESNWNARQPRRLWRIAHEPSRNLGESQTISPRGAGRARIAEPAAVRPYNVDDETFSMLPGRARQVPCNVARHL